MSAWFRVSPLVNRTLLGARLTERFAQRLGPVACREESRQVVDQSAQVEREPAAAEDQVVVQVVGGGVGLGQGTLGLRPARW